MDEGEMDDIPIQRVPLPELNIEPVVSNYLSDVLGETEHLTFGNPRGSRVKKLLLRDVWIPPRVCVADLGDTFFDAPPAERQNVTAGSELLADAALNMIAFKKSVIVAKPGYGKTTLCRSLAAIYAQRANSQHVGWIPVRVPLATVNDVGVWDSIEELLELSPLVPKRRGLTKALGNAAVAGKLFLLLDGLDEVDLPHVEEVRKKLNSLTTGTPNRVLATCRVTDYASRQPDRHLSGLPVLEISGFSEDEFDSYVERWHQAAVGSAKDPAKDPTKKTRALLNSHQDLRSLVESPLLAAILCVVGSRLPKGRVTKSGLLKHAVDYLLVDHRWREVNDLPRDGEIDDAILIELASKIAYDGQMNVSGQVTEQGDVSSKANLLDLVRCALQTEQFGEMEPEEAAETAPRYAECLIGGKSAGLLREVEKSHFLFAHRSFREYLAAAWLMRYVERPKWIEFALAGEWTEVFGYVAGIAEMTGDGATDLLTLCRSLIQDQGRGEGLDLGAPEEAIERQGQAVCLACEMLSEFGTDAARRYGFPLAATAHEASLDTETFSGLWPTAIAAGLAAASDTRLARATRIRALCIVSRLGDPRYTDGSGLPIKRVPEVVPIPGGEGHVGTNKPLPAVEMKRVRSTPRRAVQVRAFAIGRFPVMNLEYRAFIEAGGYEDARWWRSEEAGLWQRQDVQFLERLTELWDETKELNFVKEFSEPEFSAYAEKRASRIGRRIMERSRPLYWEDERFNLPSAPLVGVNLWEAQAYCSWLTDELHKAGTIESQEVVRLPTEVEWEWAAGCQWTGEPKEFPYGNDFDQNKCHLRDFSRGAGGPEIVRFGSIPVGFFELGMGQTPCPEDMGGNVWEWVNSASIPWDDKADRDSPSGLEKRIVRGGSWYTREKFASHVSFRLDDPPCNAYWDLGFRIVISRNLATSGDRQ